MEPGVYCVSGNFQVLSALNGPANDRVRIVLQNQSLTVNGTMDFDDLEIYGHDGGFKVSGALRADRLRFFSTGTGNVDVIGSGELTSGNAYFYLHQGDIGWAGGSNINLHGPPQDDPFGIGGLLVHKPWENKVPLHITGGSNINITGTFMAPGSEVVFDGGTTFELHSQIIASQFRTVGTTKVDIWYDPSENYTPPDSPTIEFTK
jgi:hypothetical protein